MKLSAILFTLAAIGFTAQAEQFQSIANRPGIAAKCSQDSYMSSSEGSNRSKDQCAELNVGDPCVTKFGNQGNCYTMPGTGSDGNVYCECYEGG